MSVPLGGLRFRSLGVWGVRSLEGWGFRFQGSGLGGVALRLAWFKIESL